MFAIKRAEGRKTEKADTSQMFSSGGAAKAKAKAKAKP